MYTYLIVSIHSINAIIICEHFNYNILYIVYIFFATIFFYKTSNNQLFFQAIHRLDKISCQRRKLTVHVLVISYFDEIKFYLCNSIHNPKDI